MTSTDMKTVIVAFDIDGTLVSSASAHIIQERRPIDKPYDYDSANLDIVELLIILSRFKNIKILVWSGGGKQYADMWVDRLKLNKWVWRTAGKTEAKQIRELGYQIIGIDDQHSFSLGDVNLIVRQK